MNLTESDLQLKKLKEETVTQELSKLINSEMIINKLPERKINYKPKYYKIKAIDEKSFLGKTQNEENENDKKGFNGICDELGYETFREELVLLSEEDVYFITKKLYDNYTMIDKNDYDLKIELHKMEIKTLTGKLMSYHPEQKKIIPNYSGISKEDFMKFKQDMSERQYRLAFLERLNNFRAVGIFEIPKEQFDLLSELFIIISENIQNEKNNKKILDEESCRFIIVLALTFFFIDKQNEKTFIQNKIKDYSLFHMKEFWSLYEMNVIGREFKKAEGDMIMNGVVLDKNAINKRNGNIVFAQLMALISNMSGFGVGEDIMKEVILPLIFKFQIPEEQKEIILNMIENLKEEG